MILYFKKIGSLKCNFFLFQNFVTPRKKGLQRAIQKIKDEHKKAEKDNRTPIITTKRSEFNFYLGDKFNKFQPIMITQGWFHPRSKMDYFTIHPPKEVSKLVKLLFII